MTNLVQKLALIAGVTVSSAINAGCGAVTALRETPATTPVPDVPQVMGDVPCGVPVACTPNAVNQPCANVNEMCQLSCNGCLSGSCRIAADGCLRWQGLLGGGPLAPPEYVG